jgi:hypothetical protein
MSQLIEGSRAGSQVMLLLDRVTPVTNKHGLIPRPHSQHFKTARECSEEEIDLELGTCMCDILSRVAIILFLFNFCSKPSILLILYLVYAYIFWFQEQRYFLFDPHPPTHTHTQAGLPISWIYETSPNTRKRANATTNDWQASVLTSSYTYASVSISHPTNLHCICSQISGQIDLIATFMVGFWYTFIIG